MHIRFPNKNEAILVDKNLFPSINTLFVNMMIVANNDNILSSYEVTFAIIIIL